MRAAKAKALAEDALLDMAARLGQETTRFMRLFALGVMCERVLRSGEGVTLQRYSEGKGMALRIDGEFPLTPQDARIVRQVMTGLCLCLFEGDVIVRTDDLCPLHSKRPGVRPIPPAEKGQADA